MYAHFKHVPSLTECTVHLVLRMKGGGKCKFTMDEDLLDEKYNYDFTNLKDDGKHFVRGGRKYIRPYGWKRVALNVKDRYDDTEWILNVKDKYDDTEWIGGVRGTNRAGSVSKEWPVSYHGTKDTFAKVIAADGYDLRKGERFKYGKGELTSITIA